MNQLQGILQRQFVVAGLALALAGIPASAPGAPVTFTIQAAEAGNPISSDQFGIVFEDLNYAADGGLYADLIQNRSFEYSPAEQSSWSPTSFWELRKRGGGVVQFASYAPLLARRNHTQWHPDLIYFTGTEVFPTANYHVQKLFGQNSGDVCLPTMVETTNPAAKCAVSTVRDSKSGDLIFKIVNWAGTSMTTKVELAGIPEMEWAVTRTVLTGENADAYNEDGRKAAVKPIAQEIKLRSNFSYEVPANSLSIFRFKSH